MASVINIPESLAHELDQLAEAERKQMSTYVVEVLWNDVKRNKQRNALKLSAGAWDPNDHPELAHGGAAYVEKIRSEPDERSEDAMHPGKIS
jgi:hypothetical protein